MSLKRDLGFLDVFCIAAGAMVSSGLFVLPAILFTRVGPGAILCYLVASILVIPALLTKVELSTALPKACGDYFHIDRSIGPTFGMLGGLAAWAALSFKTAFALIGLGAFARLVAPGLSGLQMRLVAVAFCVVFTALNVWGAKHAGKLQVVVVALLLALLGGYVALGFGKTEAARYTPLLPHGPMQILLGAAMAFVSFGGITKVASVAEEVKNPGRNLPLGMIAAYVVVSLFYLAVVFVTVGVVPAERLGPSLTPIADGGQAIWPTVGLVAMSLAAVLAFVSTGNAGILAASRSPLAMSRDGLLPAWFSRVNESRGTPHWAIVFTGLFIAVLLFLPIELFVKSASAMKILLFTFSLVSLILMRESRMASYEPAFRAPGYPWLQIIGVIAYVFLLVELGTAPLFIATLILGCGMLWYKAYAKRRVARESALVHLAQRIASRVLEEDHDLEAELAEIVHERDGATEDRFDRLVKDAVVLDLSGPTTREELFHAVAEKLAWRLDMAPADILRLLEEREEATSTVIRPGLAIPHIVVQGEERFDLLLARSRDGVAFEPGEPPVHAVFTLIGSPDQRNLHLRALAAIAEIAQDPHFDRRWLRARNAEQLRALVLHAKRRRMPEGC
jgi:amino acid transporter/mannitol/fructose-specific phosphotransferase system IIA component (Ntr-type)